MDALAVDTRPVAAAQIDLTGPIIEADRIGRASEEVVILLPHEEWRVENRVGARRKNETGIEQSVWRTGPNTIQSADSGVINNRSTDIRGRRCRIVGTVE